MTAQADPDFECVGAACKFTGVEMSPRTMSDPPPLDTVVPRDSTCNGIRQTYFAFQVDRQAEFVLDSMLAASPDPYAVARGFAVQFVVDELGKPEPGSLKFLRITGGAAAQGRVRETFPQWRFIPALRQGCPVRQLVHVEVRVGAARPFVPM